MTDSTQKISVKELIHWLSGVEDMQEDGWHPSAVQWKKIREKIGMLQENSPPSYAPPLAYPTYQQQPGTQIPRTAEPNVLEIIEAPAMSTSLAPQGFPMPNNSGGMQMNPNPNGQLMTTTPDIDTSNGPYRSSFA